MNFVPKKDQKEEELGPALIRSLCIYLTGRLGLPLYGLS